MPPAKNNKKKGNSIELGFAKLLSKRFDDVFKRVPASGAIGTNIAKSGIREDALEILTGDLICPKWFFFSVEVKGRKKFNFWDLLRHDEVENNIDKWIKQAEGEATITNKKWMIIVRINNKKPFAVVRSDENDIDIERSLIYKNKYAIIRWDYFLELPDEFFGKVK
jgi:hypothetical protein